jgi:hypothetical protein
MDSLNEQINRIKQLFNYKVGVLINEQEISTIQNTKEKVGDLTYLIMAGASNVPMRSETLHNNQGFPLPKGSTSMDVFLYEIKLSDALNDDFSKATIINKVSEKNRDQIIFGEKSITNKGSIRVPINQNTINQTIKVSGNGALVLSRAVNFYPKKLDGILILELSSKELYGNRVSLDELGITKPNLIAKANSTLNGLIYYLNNEKGKSQLDNRHVNFIDYPDKHWVSIKDLNNKIIPINNKWTDKLTSFKSTIDQDNYKIKYKLVTKVIKDNIITPGLNGVLSRVSKLISDNFPTIPNDIVEQFTFSINNIIKATDDFLSAEYIKKYLEGNSYTKSESGEKKETPKPSFKTTEIKYKEGEG